MFSLNKLARALRRHSVQVGVTRSRCRRGAERHCTRLAAAAPLRLLARKEAPDAGLHLDHSLLVFVANGSQVWQLLLALLLRKGRPVTCPEAQ